MTGKPKIVDEVAQEEFARELIRLRTEADLSQRELGRLTDTSGQQVGAIERLQRRPSKDFTVAADKALGANGRLRNLWPQGRAAPSRWLQKYVDIEAKALVIQQFQAQVVPALVQSEPYARATLEAAYPPSPPEKLHDLLQSRLQRQKLLDRSTPPLVQYVIDEATLHRTIGGPDVMREQFQRIVDVVTSKPFVTVQVLPYGRGAHCALEGSFTLLGMAPSEYLVYSEGAGRGTLYTEPDLVAANTLRFGALRSLALTPAESVQMIQSLAERGAA
ncbi:helix-turn-helix transcriptional regulator [Nocardiopsis sp. CC223A]|uniref:helix-turn-helix domain-containing protein n=1 Tax=Nocardiopsis sp. CC223A TaxID=3044051 RepID=UPI0027951F6A|nr:helix-turn-helix transcriptional regulator [Nocardiopsis sp. CC223A]